MTKENKFQVPVSFKDKATKDTAQFIFQQAEKSLIETIETDKSLTDRCYRLAAMITPAIIALIGLSLSRIESKKYDVFLLIMIVSILFLTYAAVCIYNIFFPKKMILNGSRPSKTMNEKILTSYENYEVAKKNNKSELTDEEINIKRLERQVIAFYLWEARNYERRINENHDNNEARAKSLASAFQILIWMILTDFCLFFMYFFLQCYQTIRAYLENQS